MKKTTLLTLLILHVINSYAQEAYYDDVDLTKTGLALKSELATKIIDTHTNFLTYTPDVWEASRITDLDPNNANNVLLIYGYSDTDGNYVTDRSRDKNENGGSSGSDWNREHTYPRSLGNPNLGSSGPGSDAHHLRPSDVTMNSNRSNFRFVEGSGNANSVSNGWYPGDEWKGDVARMMMYMYLRYGEQCLPSEVGVGSSVNTPDDMIDLFLDWNAEDPVSPIEDQRNTYHENTINSNAQGNRNPFIDNPYLATLIWGGTPAQDRWNLPTANTSDFNLDNALKMYPNPSSNGTLNLIISNNLLISEITVYSVLGKKVFHSLNPDFNNEKISIHNLKTGMYLVKINIGENSVVKKFIVQ